jgi:murein DD-endopeptidase MepM/ murein hydrolase activator NlpD
MVVVQCWTRNDDKIVLAVRAGTPVRAAGAGYVTYAGDFGRYGHMIIIRHPNGFASTYAHVGTFEVKRGDQVELGQVISTMAAEDSPRGSELLFQLVDRGKAVVQSRYVTCH